MKLTGKCKSEFEKWLHNHFIDNPIPTYSQSWNFYGLPEAMQWGIIQDWADSLGFMIKAEHQYTHSENFMYEVLAVVFGISEYRSGIFKTRQEARTAAIEKLNEIINEK